MPLPNNVGAKGVTEGRKQRCHKCEYEIWGIGLNSKLQDECM